MDFNLHNRQPWSPPTHLTPPPPPGPAADRNMWQANIGSPCPGPHNVTVVVVGVKAYCRSYVLPMKMCQSWFFSSLVRDGADLSNTAQLNVLFVLLKGKIKSFKGTIEHYLEIRATARYGLWQ